MQKIGIGIAGLGTVGAGVYKHLTANRALLSKRLGYELTVQKIVVRDLAKPRSVSPPASLMSTRLDDLLEDPAIQIIVELIGGVDQARAFVLRAIEQRKIVVTGNKALLAEHGEEIFAAATKHRVPIFFEAAVAGGIPIIKSVREALIGNHIESIRGIINGTSNYILSRMTEAGLSFADALKEAQEQGYAEADPTLDINGWDAAHKAIILASLAYGKWVGREKISVEGIEKITAEDITFADRLGFRIKLLAIIKAAPKGEIEVRVHPTLIPKTHVMASVNGVFNAIAIRGDLVGDTLFYGRGAGQDPTASAIISDLAEAAVALEIPRLHYGFVPHGLYGGCKKIGDIVSQYYLRLTVDDEIGVLAQVTGIFAANQIGISAIMQPEGNIGERIPLMLILHDASNTQMENAIREIAALESVKETPQTIRIEHF